uniref:uncharacterized protein LOC122584236 n=1 Tax=Erigeron canadensis TaxID=72917 RepID=UPI001CB8C01F|nr:uncharacterized protein LOC122584236 [Erigeron canadensis]
MLATKISRPIALDDYTSSMCSESWGHSSFALALIELDAENEVKTELIVGIPNMIGDGFTKQVIKIEYQWKPPRCATCKVFNHESDQCPKLPKQTTQVEFTQDEGGFTMISRKKKKGKVVQQERHIEKVNEDPFAGLSRNQQDESDDEIECVIDKREIEARFKVSADPEGASTPVSEMPHLDRIFGNVFPHWNWTSNAHVCGKNSRIIIGWDPNIADLMVLSLSDQVIHSQIIFKANRKVVLCSFVYAHNIYIQRRDLWNNLVLHKAFVHDKPWVLLGDFNAALFLNDKVVSSSNVDISMREFKDCVKELEISDVNKSGYSLLGIRNQKGSLEP